MGTRCFAACGFSSVNDIVGEFLTGGGLEEINSLASLTFICVVVNAEVLAVALSLIGGLFCYRGSERLSSLSDVACQSICFSSFRPRGFSDFSSSGMNPPLYYLRSDFPFIIVRLCMSLTKFFDFLKETGNFFS